MTKNNKKIKMRGSQKNKENLPYLKRKYKKLKTFLDIDDKETEKSLLKLNGRVLKLEDSCV